MSTVPVKVLFVVASVGYQPKEYTIPKQIVSHEGIEVVTASNGNGVATASDGSSTKIDFSLNQINLEGYAGIFFIGGPGALESLDNQESYRLLSQAQRLNIPYGAICISPRILAHAHTLTGKRATGWDGDGKLTEVFNQSGVIRVAHEVVIDGNVVTASGPEAAHEFGKAIVSLVKR